MADTVWSFSRITSFEDCRYKFFLSYIRHCDKKRLFFSDYGSFIHKIIEKYLKGELSKNELLPYYTSNFKKEVKGKAPSRKLFKNYFEQGMRYFANIKFPYEKPYAIEHRVKFDIDGKPFVGIIDCLVKDKNLVILDNKSKCLKNRSNRATPTKSDIELSSKLRQLYLYSIPIKCKFDRYPDRLEFNCFRSGELVSEPFKIEDFYETKKWASDLVNTIINNEDWSPNMEYWKCNYLCDVHDHCEYFQLNKK